MRDDPAGQGSTDTCTDEPSSELWKAVAAMERLRNKHVTNVVGRRQSRYSEDV